MRRTRALEASAIALVCCVATACGGGDGAAPTPSASVSDAPSSTATGDASETTTPSPSSSVSDPAQDPLYLEAVAVYRKYFAEMQKFEAAQYPGGKLPASMDAYITGDMKIAVQAAIDDSLAQHLVPQRGRSGVLTAVAPDPGISKGASLVGIRVCVDGRKVPAVNSQTQKVVGSGVLAYKEIFFKKFAGSLKAFESDAKQVAKCPI